MKPKILIADDHKATRQSIRMILSTEPYELIEASDLEETHRAIQANDPDLVLLDIHFGEKKTSLSLLKRLAEEQLEPTIIMLSGAASAREAAEAIKYGAHDYLEKPVSADRLKVTISKGLEYSLLKRHLLQATSQSNQQREFVGRSERAAKVRRQITRFAANNITVLITGETGTGKDIVAHGIWQASERKHRPFVAVNCAAIPENLIESELFGHKRGAFTGAHADQIGKIVMAHQGTLFLDEIGELSLGAQTKLLRFIETGEIQRVGATELQKVDVRIIAATSRDLEKEMAQNHFRSDLFYRLNVVNIQVPPLRERAEDIPLLFTFFVRNLCRKYEEPEKLVDPEALALLSRCPWPGNVRELRNIAEKAVVMSGHRILAEHVEEWLPRVSTPLPSKGGLSLSLKEFKTNVERDYIISVLRKAEWSVTEAAKLLAIDRTYLHQKMTHLGIDRPD
ncbi:MAG: sigma-54-dependent Fis family transcriptional regulator [Deltaproteobacteria bacterium]|nr:sigma-54-dependent Fis family transcriptional regulator [Deltaproteobacteria bacterium]